MKKAIVDLLLGTVLMLIAALVWSLPIRDTFNWFLSDLFGFKITLVQALAIDFIYAMLSFKVEGKSYTIEQRFENFAIHIIMALYTWGLVYSIYVVTN